MVKPVKKGNPYCCFAFKYHWLKKHPSRKVPMCYFVHKVFAPSTNATWNAKYQFSHTTTAILLLLLMFTFTDVNVNHVFIVMTIALSVIKWYITNFIIAGHKRSSSMEHLLKHLNLLKHRSSRALRNIIELLLLYYYNRSCLYYGSCLHTRVAVRDTCL